MGTLQTLALQLDADERTLRRSVEAGTIRAERLSPRRLTLDPGERTYLLSHWHLLTSLRRALRTEPSVRLAVLYGSVATGDDDADSDIDLLVDGGADDLRKHLALRRRLERLLGRPVHLVSLEAARRSPSLLADALTEGRTIVDRERRWRKLQRQRARVLRAAANDEAGQARAAGDALRASRGRLQT